MKTRLYLIGLLVSIFSAAVAQNDNSSDSNQQNNNQNISQNSRGIWFDTDNDGICDRFEAYGAPGRGLGPGRGQGLRQRGAIAPGSGYGRGFRGGRGYVNTQTEARGVRQGMLVGQGRGSGPGFGRGFGPGRGRGMAPGGRYYTDGNKNEVCDFYERSLSNQ